MAGEIVQSDGGKATQPGGLVIPESWGIGGNFGQLVTSEDESTQKGRDKLLHLLGKDHDPPEEWINKEFMLEGVTITPISWIDDATGEEVRTVRVLLTTLDGKVIDFRSAGIIKSLYLLFRFRGQPPYKKGLKVVLHRKKLRSERSMYELQLID